VATCGAALRIILSLKIKNFRGGQVDEAHGEILEIRIYYC
jgi:hypothetical protein